MEQHIAQLNEQLVAQEDEIQQLRMELAGAAEAAQAARAAADHARVNVLPRAHAVVDTENILKTLQTPQIIRDLPNFEGNPIKLHAFIRAIDSIMPTLNRATGTDAHRVWIQAIRTKIIGEADNVLEMYGTSLDWDEIKQNLITHYSDRRDEVSLTRDLFTVHQTGTVEDFYSRISYIVSLLVNLLNISEEHIAVKNAKNNFYQQLGLKVFLGGLKEPLGPIIRAQAPGTLKEALRLCIEENNYHHTRTIAKSLPTPPPIPQRLQFQQRSFPQMQQRTFPQPQQRPFPQPQQRSFPQMQQRPIQFPQHKPFQFQQQRSFQFPQRQFPFPQQGQFQNPQQRSLQFNQQRAIQNSLPKPTPMEVDPSIRSRRINYMNRPHFQIEGSSSSSDCQEFYVDDDEFYYQMYDPYNQTYQNEHENSNNQPVETPPNQEANQENKESKIDDLNFHQVAEEHLPT